MPLTLIVIAILLPNSSAKPATPYNPKPLMAKLEATKDKPITDMYFLVFGDSKLSPHFNTVLKRADTLAPDFNITTADLVDTGGGTKGVTEYEFLEQQAGWFFKKYPTWPSVGNHELNKEGVNPNKPGFDKDGYQNFASFFGITEYKYAFNYGNATFIALDWPKIKKDTSEFHWLETTLQAAQGKHIFIFKHRPYYTIGSKSLTDVAGKPTDVTKLFTQYNVTAVFSGHDHTYYRTKRDGVYYITSAGAGATIYALKRETDAIAGDVYYGKNVKKKGHSDNDKKESYRFHSADGKPDEVFSPAIYFVLSVQIKGEKITFKMIQAANGKTWDKITFNNPLKKQ